MFSYEGGVSKLHLCLALDGRRSCQIVGTGSASPLGGGKLTSEREYQVGKLHGMQALA